MLRNLSRFVAVIVASVMLAPSLAQDDDTDPDTLPSPWGFVSSYAISEAATRLEDVTAACRDFSAPYFPEWKERTLISAESEERAPGETMLTFRMARWTKDQIVIVRFQVLAEQATVQAKDGVLSITGESGALEGYNWLFTADGEPSFAGPSPDTMPFEVPCTDAETAASRLNQALLLLPAERAIPHIVEDAYLGYLSTINEHFFDDRLDPLIAVCRGPEGTPRPKSELISGGYIDREGDMDFGRVYVTITSHDDQSKEMTTYYLDPHLTFTRRPESQVIALDGGDGGTAGHVSYLSPLGEVSHLTSFEAVDGYSETHAFHCADPDRAAAVVHGLRGWIGAGLSHAPEITYAVRFDRESNQDTEGCLFNDAAARAVAEEALYAEGLHPRESAEANITFVLTPLYADTMLPDQCHYSVDATASWDLSDPGALLARFEADPVETSFRDLDHIASRAARDFLIKQRAPR